MSNELQSNTGLPELATKIKQAHQAVVALPLRTSSLKLS